MPKKTKSSDKEDLQDEDDNECCDIFVLKNVLFLFNFLLLLSGVALLGVGIWTILDKHSYVALLATGVYQTTSYLLVFIGVLIVVVVFALGCCGAWKENKILLAIYAALLILIFLLEAICGILAYFYEARIHDELVEHLNETMTTKYRHDIAITQSIDSMQLTFKCCGAESHLDWIYSKSRVPESCCKTPSIGCADRSHHPSNINYKGCVYSLAEFLRSHLMVIGAIGLGLCCLQIFGAVFSCWLIKKIRDRDGIPRSPWR